MRTVFYRRMARMGNLQLLCEKCHRRKTFRENREAEAGQTTTTLLSMNTSIIKDGEQCENQPKSQYPRENHRC